MENIDLFYIVATAFIGSFGHCLGMCGGIVMAYSSAKIGEGTTKSSQVLMHLLYSFGRITTYMLLGAIFGYLGGVVTYSNTTNGIMQLVAGVLMVLVGISLLGKVKFLTIIEHSLATNATYKNIFVSMLKSQSLTSFYVLGLLNGLMPCGFVYFFAITAASSADPFWGAVVMFIFGLSTTPALFSLGYFVGSFKLGNFKNLMVKLAATAVVIYGLMTINSGYEYITNPLKTLRDCH